MLRKSVTEGIDLNRPSHVLEQAFCRLLLFSVKSHRFSIHLAEYQRSHPNRIQLLLILSAANHHQHFPGGPGISSGVIS